MHFRIEHQLGVSAPDYWRFLFDPELEVAVKQAAGLKRFDVKTRHEGAAMVREVEVLPNIEVPAMIAKLVGDNIGYHETDRVPKTGAMRYEWLVVSHALPDKLAMGGSFVVEPAGSRCCQRVIEGEVKVKIFGVGGIVEKFIVFEVEKTYAIVAREQERWIRARLAAA